MFPGHEAPPGQSRFTGAGCPEESRDRTSRTIFQYPEYNFTVTDAVTNYSDSAD